MNTIASLLKKTADWFKERGIDSARLDAELLLCEVLDEKRIQLYMDPERVLSDSQIASFRELVKRRGKFEPMAYIFGEKEFWGRTFNVNSEVLIPRPDTERLIELCLERLPKDIEGRVVELGTGSGCIAVTLAAERPGLFVTATDVSAAALHIAKSNAEKHNVRDRIAFRQGDLWEACVPAKDLLLVVSNPPYIPRSQHAALMADVQFHEPHLALFDNGDAAELGTSFHRRILAGAENRLSQTGFVVFEIGFDQGAAIRTLTRKCLPTVEVFDDYGGNPRVAVFTQHAAEKKAEMVVVQEAEHQNHREIQIGVQVEIEKEPATEKTAAVKLGTGGSSSRIEFMEDESKRSVFEEEREPGAYCEIRAGVPVEVEVFTENTVADDSAQKEIVKLVGEYAHDEG